MNTLSSPQSNGTFKPMLRLALPVLLECFLHMLVGFSDTILAGNYLGPSELAAISVMNYLLWFLYMLYAVIVTGSTAMTARFIGAKDFDQANRIVGQSFWIGIFWAIVLMAIGLIIAPQAVHLLGLRGESAQLTVEYLYYVLPIMLAIMAEEIAIGCLHGAGDTISCLVVMTIVNLINLAVSWSLVLGWGPFPELGWAGLAIGTAVAHGIGGLIFVILLVKGRANLKLRWRYLKTDFPLIRRILRIGLPGGADSISIVLCHLWYLSIINRLGDIATAAHGVGVRIESLAYLPGYAFQIAASTLVGQYLGARDHVRAVRVVWVSCLTGGAVMAAAGMLMFFFPRWLAEIFIDGSNSDQLQAIELLIQLLPIVAATMPALALVMICGGALKGAGDTRWPLLFTFVGFLLIRIPLTYFFAYDDFQLPLLGITIQCLGYGVVGAWYAMVVDISARCLMVIYRFRHGGWKKIEV